MECAATIGFSKISDIAEILESQTKKARINNNGTTKVEDEEMEEEEVTEVIKYEYVRFSKMNYNRDEYSFYRLKLTV